MHEFLPEFLVFQLRKSKHMRDREVAAEAEKEAVCRLATCALIGWTEPKCIFCQWQRMNAQREDRDTSTPAPSAVTPVPTGTADAADKPASASLAGAASPPPGEQPPIQVNGEQAAAEDGREEDMAAMKTEPIPEEPGAPCSPPGEIAANGQEEVPMATTDALADPMDADTGAAEPVPTQTESEAMGSPPAAPMQEGEGDEPAGQASDETQVCTLMVARRWMGRTEAMRTWLGSEPGFFVSC
jgi:hypothetical protein